MEERDVSEFNGAQLKLFRIDEIIRGINFCRHNLDIYHWLLYLQDFDMELESVKKPDEKELTDKQLKKLSETINEFLSTKYNARLKKNVKSTPANIIDDLNQFQKELLIIFKSSGMELKLQQGAMGGFGK
jgi:predicted house-cleaning noncanonical NTP pyrophosphatase (MazG superfamily)